jgi:hypothetical protein
MSGGLPRLVLTCGIGLIVACVEPLTGPMAPGEWGGEHIGMVVTPGGAALEYDCAEGTIDQPLRPVRGKFDLSGVHYPGMGGPIGVDRTQPRPARYLGTVTETRMSLVVILTDTGESVGIFILIRGGSPHVFKCL